MELWYLLLVFGMIVALLLFKQPLYQAILAGLVAMALLFGLEWDAIGEALHHVVSKWSSLSVLLAMYLTALLQKVLEARGQIKAAQQDLDGIFHNRRVNTVGALLFIGLLPSAAAMLLAGEIVKDSTDGHLTPKEQATAASWFRHVPESSLPTYTGILLLLSITGVPAGKFLLGMLIPFGVLIAIGYFRFLRKVPRDPGTPQSAHRGKDLLRLLGHLWSLIAVVILILGTGISVVWALLIVLAAAIPIYRMRSKELWGLLPKAFHGKMLLNTLFVLILKNFITASGVLSELPKLAESLPLPTFLTFGLLLFGATIVSGSTGAIALVVPLAVGAMAPTVPLAVFLACVCHGASQLSPTHVCVAVSSEYFRVSLGETIKSTLLMSMTFIAFAIGYYLLLNLVF